MTRRPRREPTSPCRTKTMTTIDDLSPLAIDREIDVRVADRLAKARLRASGPGRERMYCLELELEGARYRGEAGNVFDALRALRRAAPGLVPMLAGCRSDVWPD